MRWKNGKRSHTKTWCVIIFAQNGTNKNNKYFQLQNFPLDSRHL